MKGKEGPVLVKRLVVTIKRIVTRQFLSAMEHHKLQIMCEEMKIFHAENIAIV